MKKMGWSRNYAACTQCNKDNFPYGGNGLCSSCYFAQPRLVANGRIRNLKRYRSDEEYRDRLLKQSNARHSTPKGRQKNAEVQKRMYKIHTEKMRGRARLAYAIKIGRVKKTPCQECGNPKVQGHHAKGYEGTNALDVMWLCTTHHGIQHRMDLSNVRAITLINE